MSDTPHKNDTPDPESTDSTENASSAPVTPQPINADGKPDSGQDKIRLQPTPAEPQQQPATAPAPEQEVSSSAASAPTLRPTPPKPAPPKPAPSKPAAQQPAASPSSKPAAAKASITFDEEPKGDAVSKPMLILDAIAAVIAVTFAVLILQDVLPFL